MPTTRYKCEEGDALQDVLAAMIDPINQLFFHSRMLRAWGHSRGMEAHDVWLARMRRATSLVMVMARCGIKPCDRPERDIVIGGDPPAIFSAEADQASRFASIAAARASSCTDAGKLLAEIVRTEHTWRDRLQVWLSGPEADERTSCVKHLKPKPGGVPVAVAAINRVLPHMTAAVSQIFFHSLMFGSDGRAEPAKRELRAALQMMYQAEALLERLLDLGGHPSGTGHGLIRISTGAQASALEAHERIITQLEPALSSLDGLTDPMTHTLIDGILRVERQERDALQATVLPGPGTTS